jgi:hypothetical protein
MFLSYGEQCCFKEINSENHTKHINRPTVSRRSAERFKVKADGTYKVATIALRRVNVLNIWILPTECIYWFCFRIGD